MARCLAEAPFDAPAGCRCRHHRAASGLGIRAAKIGVKDTAEEFTGIYGPDVSGNWKAYDGDTDVTPTTGSTATPSGNWGDSKFYPGRDNNGGHFGGHISRIAVCRGNRQPSELRTLTRAA